jgi:hypothetical protein
MSGQRHDGPRPPLSKPSHQSERINFKTCRCACHRRHTHVHPVVIAPCPCRTFVNISLQRTRMGQPRPNDSMWKSQQRSDENDRTTNDNVTNDKTPKPQSPVKVLTRRWLSTAKQRSVLLASIYYVHAQRKADTYKNRYIDKQPLVTSCNRFFFTFNLVDRLKTVLS